MSKNFFTPLQISLGTKCSRHLPPPPKKNYDNFSCIGRYWFVLIVKVKCACLLHFLCRGAEAEWDVQELREALSLPQPPARGVPARQAEAHGPLQGALSRETPVQPRRAHGELTSPQEGDEEEGLLTFYRLVPFCGKNLNACFLSSFRCSLQL